MTIENTLERIAVALESIAAGPGTTSTSPGKPAKDTSSAKPKPTSKPADKPTSKSTAGKASKPTATSSTTEDGPKIADVRKALGAVQKAFDSDTARALLKEAGEAATMSKLSEDMYQTVIDAAMAKAESA